MLSRGRSLFQTPLSSPTSYNACEDRVLDGPASGGKGSKGRNQLLTMPLLAHGQPPSPNLPLPNPQTPKLRTPKRTLQTPNGTLQSPNRKAQSPTRKEARAAYKGTSLIRKYPPP